MDAFDSSEFKIAWAKVVARASVDMAFRTRVPNDAIAVFSEYGLTLSDDSALKDYVASNFKTALDATELQRGQQQASDTSGRPISCYSYPCSDPCATQACRTPCWAATNQFPSPVGSGLGACGTTCIGGTMQSTQLSGGGGGDAATMATSDMGRMRFNCWGSAATIGCAGSFCGCAGTAGTGGTFGCGGGAQSMQMTGAASFGAPANQAGGTVGYGGGGMQSTQLTGNVNSGATLGSFATYCGSFGGGGSQPSPGRAACWGTAATAWY